MRQKTPVSKAAKRLKHEVLPLESQYKKFFAPAPSPLWVDDDVNYSLEQPHMFEYVPSETVWIIPALTQLSPNSNA